MLENFDPNTIEDEALRHVVLSLMNLVETLHAKVQEQAEEIQRLRDENNRLKGNKGSRKSKRTKQPSISLQKRNAVSPNPTTKYTNRLTSP